jgi:hypothetical protein
MKTSALKSVSPRTNRLLREHIHDPYKTRSKRREPAVCPVCRAVFRGGRWQWAATWPAEAHEEICQACRRIKDNYPGGLVTLTGGAMFRNKTEILNLVRHVEQLEMAEHPLHRLMTIEERADTVRISTTDIHLARRLGEAIHHAHKGTLAWHYNAESCFVRVNWVSAS